jgi:putative phosphonate metabolism protein
MNQASGRYAIYFAPDPDTPLARFGAEWLGYDAATGVLLDQPALADISRDRLREITEEPRHYGFHATLKPPFVLAESGTATDLEDAIAALAGRVAAFAAPRLRLSQISGFWALVLSEACPQMDHLAAVCVEELDRFRAPAPEAELARRRRAGLSAHQENLLQRWGYPYVMQEFRFHLTLTARLSGEEGEAVGAVLEPLVAPLCQEALKVGAVCLFYQEHREAPFRILGRYALTGTADP